MPLKIELPVRMKNTYPDNREWDTWVRAALSHLEGKRIITKHQHWTAISLLINGAQSPDDIVARKPKYGRFRGITSAEHVQHDIEQLVEKRVLVFDGEAYEFNWKLRNISHMRGAAERTLRRANYDELTLTAADRTFLRLLKVGA